MLDPTSLSRHYPILQFVVGLVDLHPVLGVADCSYHKEIVGGQEVLEEPIPGIAGNADLAEVGRPVQDILQVVAVEAVVLLFGVEACHSQDDADIGVDHQTDIVEEDTGEEEVVDGFASQTAVEEEVVAVAAAGEEVVAVEEAAAGLVEVVE